MFKRVWIIILLLSSFAFAQDLDSLLSVLESRREDDQWLDLITGKANYHVIYLQAGYNSNSYFEGRDVGLDQFNMSLQASYNFKQFTFTYAGVAYEALSPILQMSVLSLDYELPLKLPMDINVNYGRYFFHNPDDSLGRLYPNSLGLGIGKNAKYWGASVDLGLVVGTGGVMPQILASAYGDLELYKFNNKTNIHIRPEFGLSFGSELTARTVVPGTALGKGNGNGQGNSSNSGQGNSGNGPGQGQTTETIYSTEFGLLNTELDLNIILNLSDFTLGLGVQYNIPRSMQEDLDYAPTSMISLTGGYAFSFIK